jgi:hypothetical protein
VPPVCNPSYSGNRQFEASPAKASGILSQKQNINERAGGIVQVVECLPSVLKALGSIPSIKKKKLIRYGGKSS